MRVSAVDSEDGQPEKLWEGAITGLRSSLPGRWETNEKPLTLAGAPRKAFQVKVFTPEGNSLRETVTVAQLVFDDKRVRHLTCLTKGNAGSPERCPRLVAFLASTPWRSPPPKDVAVERTIATIAGRQLSAPQGCNVFSQVTMGGIKCGKSSALEWVEITHPGQREEIESSHMRQMLSLKPPPQAESLPCKLEGAPSTCRFFRFEKGKPEGLYMGSAQVRSRELLVMCLVEDNSGPPLACREVLELK